MTRRIRRAALVLALVAASVAAVAPSAQAAKGMEVALQDDLAFVTSSYFGHNFAQAFDLASQLEVSRLRINLVWSSVAPSPRSKKRPKNLIYRFSNYDGVIAAARQRGIKVHLTLTGPAPAWATGKKKEGVYKPKAAEFGQFAKAVTRQYRGYVDRYSIWNEPQLKAWIQPVKQNAKIYRSLYLAGYTAIKSVDPSAKVLIGETSPFSLPKGRATAPIKFINAVAKGGGLKADGYAHHPYDFRHKFGYKYKGKDNATLATLGNLTKALDKLAASGKLETPAGKPLDLYLTEWGYMAPNTKYGIKDKTRAKYLVNGFKLALANPRVKSMLQYLLVQPSKRYRFFDMSLVNRKGKQSASFKALSNWAKSAVASGDIAKPGGGPAYK